MSLLLKVLLLEVSTWWRGWVLLSRILCSLHSILLSDTTKESSWTPRMEPAFLMILLILPASAALSLLPQHTTAKKMELATTDW